MKKTFTQPAFYFIVACAVATLFATCRPLDQTSPNEIAADAMFKDANSTRAAVAGMYSLLQQRDYYGGYFQLTTETVSDNGDIGGYDITELQELGNRNPTPANLYIQKMWTAMYRVSASANNILANLGNVPDLDDAERAKLKGQALTMRALVHFDVLRMWGYHWDLTSKFGVPIIRTTQAYSDIVPRSSVQESYDFIEQDLLTAEQLLTNSADRDAKYINVSTVRAFLSRLYLYKKDYTKAANYATLVLNDATYNLIDNATNIYSTHQTTESIFELFSDPQNPSQLNNLTYSRPEATISEVFFLANGSLKTLFDQQATDQRYNLVVFDTTFAPTAGRTLKYRSPVVKDAPAYVVRLAEVLLIRAEALGLANGGLNDLNTIHTKRGLTALTATDVPTAADFAKAVQNERRAELNFEGHRYFDLARTQTLATVLGIDAHYSAFPIPRRELIATNGQLIQNDGY